MAERATQDDALVRLNTLLPADEAFASRSLTLTSLANTVTIGRASKRRTSLEASPTNACYDCPVMSRNHAELKLDSDQKRVLLRDIGSLHGTSLNKLRLQNDEVRVVQNGDIITFGMTIDRGSATYTPYEVEAEITWHPSRPTGNPVTYRVPDETDIEDNSSDEYSGTGYAQRVIKDRMMPMPGCTSRSAPIDLTGKDDEVTSNTQNAKNDLKFIDLTKLGPPPHRNRHVEQEGPEEQPATIPAGSILVGNSGHTSNRDMAEEEDHVSRGLPPPRAPLFDWMEDDEDYEDTSSVESSDAEDEPEDFQDEDEHDQETSLSYEEDEVEFDEHDDFEDDFEEEEEEGEEEFSVKPSGPPLSMGIMESNASLETPRDKKQPQPQTNDAVQFDLPEFLDREVHRITTAENNTTAHHLPSYAPQSYEAHLGLDSNFSAEPLQQAATLPNMAAIDQSFAPRLAFLPEQHTMAPIIGPLDPDVAAESLSKKSGKAEYFQAREENRRTLGFPTNSSQTNKETTAAESGAPATTATSLEENLLQSSDDLPEKPQVEMSNDLVRSGTNFLNTPITHDTFAEIPSRPKSPAHDDSSAYQFALSKDSPPKDIVKEATASSAEEEATTCSNKEPVSSPKRKAAEISESTPREETVMASSTTIKNKASQASEPLDFTSQQPTPSQVGHKVAMKMRSEPPRPTKRLRRAAEVFGYAAIGGLAVVSALIATAPEL